jgi:hypothetical protein
MARKGTGVSKCDNFKFGPLLCLSVCIFATCQEIKHLDKKINKILSILDPKHSKGGDPTFNLPASTLRTATNLADFSGAAGGCESSFDFSYFDHPFVSPTTSLRRSIRAASPAYAW